MMARSAQVTEVRHALVDPARVCQRLGVGRDARRQAGGLLIRCPKHSDRTPSCSVTRGPDGTLRAHCFGCGWSADAIGLVAAVRGLDSRREFHKALAAAAELGGLHQLVAELNGVPRPNLRIVLPPPEPPPERAYPAAHEVLAVWSAARPVADVKRCAAALALRGLFPSPDVARALSDPPGAIAHPGSASRQQSEAPQLPSWARYQGRSWFETGHRVLLPIFDPLGNLRSLRAWQVARDALGPKRLPPAGHKTTELVLANELGLALLRVPVDPARLLIAEGEPDFLSLCQQYPGVAVLGVMSGSWTEAFARRIPYGSLVTIRTHRDPAGDRYADNIAKTLAGRALVKRGWP